jgi:uncharacterized protein with ParB-like and HNH nuclease domain
MNEGIDDIFEDIESEYDEEGVSFQEYDITSSPNDFNMKTIVDFIESGVFEIPTFQRHYVWDIGRASKLIESIILGLPVPQIFLYEKARNKYLVIDGQQRLMSIYYFFKMRFPRVEKRDELRGIFYKEGKIPQFVLADDTYFVDFRLHLPLRLPKEKNSLNKLTFETLDDLDLQKTFLLRTIRCVMVKQNLPRDDGDSSVFEIFHRLNSGGVNLSPQEIRVSFYHSDFMTMILKFNSDERWRTLLTKKEPDLRMRDIEVLLRGFAMLIKGEKYTASMVRFMNEFARDMQSASSERIVLLERILANFFDQCQNLPEGVFGTGTKKLNISVYEAVFATMCKEGYINKSGMVPSIDQDKISKLKKDPEFVTATSSSSTSRENVNRRLRRAKEILLA